MNWRGLAGFGHPEEDKHGWWVYLWAHKGVWTVALGGTIFRNVEYYLIDREWNLYVFCSASWLLIFKLLLGRYYVSK